MLPVQLKCDNVHYHHLTIILRVLIAVEPRELKCLKRMIKSTVSITGRGQRHSQILFTKMGVDRGRVLHRRLLCASLRSSWSPASAICQTSSTVSSASSLQHFGDPCIFCRRTNSQEFTARLSEGSSAVQASTVDSEQFRRDLKMYLFAGHSRR